MDIILAIAVLVVSIVACFLIVKSREKAMLDKIESLNDSILSQKSALDALTKHIDSLSSPVAPHRVATAPIHRPEPKCSPKVADAAPREFYMTRALSNGLFAESALRNSRDESTYYTFFVNPSNPDTVSFEFAPFDALRMKKAFENRRETIENACDLIIENKNSFSCSCFERGEAVRRGNDWLVTKKAKVKY